MNLSLCVRLPVTTLKEPRWGVVSFADSLDCVGVLAKSVHTVKEVFGVYGVLVELSSPHEQCLDVISVYDARDPTAASPELRKKASSIVESSLTQVVSGVRINSLDGLRIGIPQVVMLHSSWSTDSIPLCAIYRSTSLLN